MYRLVIWGTGNYYNRYINRFMEHDILAVVDNDASKQGKMIDGYTIISPEDVRAYNADYYIILCAKYEPIKKQMIQLGIKENAIIVPNSEGAFKQFRKVYRAGRKEKGDILLFSHAMDMRGAPLMLYELSKVLKKRGVFVDVATSSDGPLEEEYIKNDISVLKYDDYDFCPGEIKKFFGEYKYILVNTLALNALVNLFIENGIKIYWWIHEEWSAYKILNVDKNIDVRSNYLRVLCVGNRAKISFLDYFGATAIEQLQWGIELSDSRGTTKNNKEVIVAVIGPLIYIKGQDLFLDLRDKQEWMSKNRIKVWFIGNAEEKERQKYAQIEWIEIKGEYSHNQLLDLYDEVDVVLSTSRNDTMPVSLIEGLMKKKLVVSSDGTGVSDYIKTGVNGVVFKRDESSELWSALEWIIKNKSKWDEIRENGFELYLKNFSIECFEKQIERLFEI